MLSITHSRNQSTLGLQQLSQVQPYHRFCFWFVVLLALCIFSLLTIRMMIRSTEYTSRRPSMIQNGRKYYVAEQPSLWKLVGCKSHHPILLCNESSQYITPASLEVFKQHRYLKTRHKDCSLVGSSGNLLLHKHGREIDKKSLVIRINNPPLKGYKEHVGKRPADVMIVNNFVRNCHWATHNDTLRVRPVRASSVHFCQSHGTVPLYAISDFIYNEAAKTLKWYSHEHQVNRTSYVTPTSGLKALLFCMLICEDVYVYGFGTEETRQWHYYSKREFLPKHHDVSLETRIIRDIGEGKLNRSAVGLAWSGFGNVHFV